MRKIVVEVPEKKCWPKWNIKCPLIKHGTCPFRGIFHPVYKAGNLKPTKACREAEVTP